MNLEQYRVVFLIITIGLALFAAYPLLAVIVDLPDSSEKFSEIWLLDSEHTTSDYPFNVTEGESNKIFVSLGNQMGSSEYYLVKMNFGNTTQLLLNESAPSSLPTLYEFRAFVGDESSWESPVNFVFQNIALKEYEVRDLENTTIMVFNENSTMSVKNIVINNAVFPVDASTSYDFQNDGFYFRLAFELWRYDQTLKDFSFYDAVVGLRFNMTATP